MLSTIVIAVTLSTLTGWAVKAYLDRTKAYSRITRNEFIVGFLISTLVVIPATSAIGEHVAIAEATSFNEYWDGWETAATVDVITCTRDGACRHTYQCDPYEVWVPPTYDKDGHQTGGGYWETHYHSCPVGTEEATYSIDTTLGSTVVASGHFTPNTHPWRSGVALNGPTDPPAEWAQAKARLDAGQPGGVTDVHTYDNYILASQDALLSKYSASIDKYLDAGVLPTISKGATNLKRAPKVYFVGCNHLDQDAWVTEEAKVNAALGTLRQGDLHLVLVCDPSVKDSDDYANALLAYWQSPKLGDNAASKNTVTIVVGTDGRTVKWARMGTGMPIGNERPINAARTALKGVALTPQALLGSATAKVVNGKVAKEGITIVPGAITNLLFDKDNGFVRVRMSTHDNSGVGYEYLKSQIHPSAGARVWITAVGFLLSLLVWGALVYVGAPTSRDSHDIYAGYRSAGLTRPRPAADDHDDDLYYRSLNERLRAVIRGN